MPSGCPRELFPSRHLSPRALCPGSGDGRRKRCFLISLVHQGRDRQSGNFRRVWSGARGEHSNWDSAPIPGWSRDSGHGGASKFPISIRTPGPSCRFPWAGGVFLSTVASAERPPVCRPRRGTAVRRPPDESILRKSSRDPGSAAS